MLANALRTQLRRLISNEPRLAERLEVHSINAIGERLYKSHFGQINLAAPEVVQGLLRAASERGENHKFSERFLLTEWEQVVDAWQLDTWEAYRDVARLGRKTRLPEAQREILWSMFEQVRAGLASRNMITRSTMFTKLAAAVAESRNPPFDFAVVDEAQDIGVAHLRFFAGLGRHRPDALFFAGDLGQRIFQQPFSWLAFGRGYSGTVEGATGQLPHVTSDPGAGGPIARSRGIRCRWQQGEATPRRLRLQWAAAGDSSSEQPGRRS